MDKYRLIAKSGWLFCLPHFSTLGFEKNALIFHYLTFCLQYKVYLDLVFKYHTIKALDKPVYT